MTNTPALSVPSQRSDASNAALRSNVARDIRHHSMLVSVLRWLLPVGCLVVIGIFLYSSGILEDLLFPQAQEPDPVIAEDTVEMVQPSISGLDKKDRAYEISAKTAKQNIDDPTKVALETLTGSLDLGSGNGRVHMSADTGFLDTQANTLKLRKNIVVTTKEGHRANLSSANIKLKERYIITDEPVLIKWDGGTIRSIGMEVKDKGNIIRFLSRVKVHLNSKPGKKEVN